jgi:hypothetical protein
MVVFFEFYIGGQLIERIEDDYVNCLAQISITPGLVRSFAKMIGQDIKLILKIINLIKKFLKHYLEEILCFGISPKLIFMIFYFNKRIAILYEIYLIYKITITI